MACGPNRLLALSPKPIADGRRGGVTCSQAPAAQYAVFQPKPGGHQTAIRHALLTLLAVLALLALLLTTVPLLVGISP